MFGSSRKEIPDAGIVNRHYRHPLARLWGGGTLSSSDGQRFPMAVRSGHRHPAFLRLWPRANLLYVDL
jgi:TnpA family transposase